MPSETNKMELTKVKITQDSTHTIMIHVFLNRTWHLVAHTDTLALAQVIAALCENHNEWRTEMFE